MKTIYACVIALIASVTLAGEWEGHEQLLVNHPTILEMHRIQTKHRASHGKHPQTLNAELCRAAQEWSEYMAEHHYFEHSHYPVAENIAVGANTASGAMSMWINSRGHNANLLGGGGQVGFGVAKAADGTRYWTSCHGDGFKVVSEK